MEKQRQLGLGLGVTGQLQFAAVGGRDMDVDHLNGGEVSSTLRGVRPGASPFRRRPRVTCRQ